MLVVADATPLHYLILIDEVELLRKLYGSIVIPAAVIRELSHVRTPDRVRDWIGALPSWVKVVSSGSAALPFEALGLGEREAIATAQRSAESILLTDDSRARKAAGALGIRTIPTIRILSTAGELGLIDFENAVRLLKQTNFRVSSKLVESLPKRSR